VIPKFKWGLTDVTILLESSSKDPCISYLLPWLFNWSTETPQLVAKSGSDPSMVLSIRGSLAQTYWNKITTIAHNYIT
jgi:hypothetical protein